MSISAAERRRISLIGSIHSRVVLGRRLRVLAEHALSLLPEEGKLLDVGCGNGVISRLIEDVRPGIRTQGIDILERPTCAIPMKTYDGSRFPHADKSFDFVMFIDVLHHTPDPYLLLEEAVRVARQAVIVKDHLCESSIARRILKCMDYVGNRPHGVALLYNYWSSSQWADAWAKLQVQPDATLTRLGLYPWFARPLFEHGLHFISRVPPR